MEILQTKENTFAVSNTIYPNIFKPIKKQGKANLEVPKPYPVIQNGECKHVVHEWLTLWMIPWCTKDLVENKPVSFSFQGTGCALMSKLASKFRGRNSSTIHP